MYWLAIVAAAVAWMLVARRGVPEPVVAIRPPTPRVTVAERWNRATGTERVTLAAMTFGKAVWIGFVLAALVAMTIGTATWMY